jgi:hypothetical protein
VTTRHWKMAACRAAGIIFAALAMIVLSAPPASSQGVFETLLGIIRPSAPRAFAPQTSSFAPALLLFAPPSENRSSSEGNGPYASYCVRLCDGSFFPLQRNSATSPAEQCRSFCPAAKTKIFSGSKINSAVAPDGSRYADLPNALLYRTRVVDNCTCNGRNAFGVARTDIAADPTLRTGDIVAINGGFAAYTGSKSIARQPSDFTPIERYSGLSNDTRRKLSETKVMPARQAAAQPPALIRTDGKSPGREDRRAQLSR